MLLILLSTFYLFVIHILQKYFKSATHKMMNKQWLFINISLLLLSITFKKKNEFKHVLIFSKQLNKSRTRYNQVVSNERDSAKPF